MVSSVEWKQAKDALYKEFGTFLAHGGIPARPDDEKRRQKIEYGINRKLCIILNVPFSGSELSCRTDK